MTEGLSRCKEDKVKGGDVNYYLQDIFNSDGSVKVTVEVEDIIEACDMLFSNATSFKSLVRLCKLRQDLGKPGSFPVYEADKNEYSAKRGVAITVRRLNNPLPLTIWDRLSRFFNRTPAFSYHPLMVLSVPDPKRLPPYSFVIDEFIQALKPTKWEYRVLHDIIAVALIRQANTKYIATEEELSYGRTGLAHAQLVQRYEKEANLNKAEET